MTTPVLVPLAWWRNRATDPGTPESGEPPLPRFVRPALLSAGALPSAVALVLLLSPSTMIEHWPRTLTSLTAQTLGGWFALPGVTALMMGLDGRWSAIQITLESQLAYVFVVGIAGLFATLLALKCAMVVRERAGGPPAPAVGTRVATP